MSISCMHDNSRIIEHVYFVHNEFGNNKLELDADTA